MSSSESFEGGYPRINEWAGVLAVLNEGSTLGQMGDDAVYDRIGPKYRDKTSIVRLDFSDTVQVIDAAEEIVERASQEDVATAALTGDGGFKWISELFVRSGIDSSIAPDWVGNASEIARMANGSPKETTVEDVLLFGNAVSVNPINSRLWLPDAEKYPHIPDEVLSFAWNGYGDTAVLSEIYDSDAHRNNRLYRGRGSRWILEGIATSKRFVTQEAFEISDQDGEKLLYDLTFAKASRMGKGVVGLPSRLDSQTIFKTCVEKGPTLSKARWTARAIMAGRTGLSLVPGTYIDQNNEPYEFAVGADTWMHSDAQTMEIPKGTQISVSRDPRSVNVLSVLLQPRD